MVRTYMSLERGLLFFEDGTEVSNVSVDMLKATPELLEAVKQLSCAIGDLCAAFCLTADEVQEEVPEVVEACNFADEVLARAKGKS